MSDSDNNKRARPEEDKEDCLEALRTLHRDANVIMAKWDVYLKLADAHASKQMYESVSKQVKGAAECVQELHDMMGEWLLEGSK